MKRNIYLRVKLKSLAAEARIIRREELKANKHRDYDLQNALHIHRTRVVRREARSTLLAYQFLRGVPYAACEPNPKTTPSWPDVTRMIAKYGRGAGKINIEGWVKGVHSKAA